MRFLYVVDSFAEVDAFTPNTSARPDFRARINVVIISRLVYRKGIDLVAKVLPMLCERFSTMHFIIGGDGVPHRTADS